MSALGFPPLPAITSSPDTVEVFKTDINSAALGEEVAQVLHHRFPALSISFDLEDCDRILRIQVPCASPDLWLQVLALVKNMGVQIDVLPN